MVSTRRMGRAGASALTAVAAVVLVGPAAGVAAPDPPPNPSDAEIQAGQAGSAQMADRVGELTSGLADAEARLFDLNAQVELKMEDANKARVDLQRAERAVQGAEHVAAGAAVEADAASRRIEDQRRRLDEFAARSYRQGSRLGSMTAFAGARNPDDLLARAELLDVIGRAELDVLEDLERARVAKVNKDSLARAAAQEAQVKQAAADQARADAEAAERAAIAAQDEQVAQNQSLEADKSEVEAQLSEARARVSGMEAQRGRYQSWLAEQRQAPAPSSSADDEGESGGGSVETVIRRAMSQLGVTYAWGGGTSSGPSRGIRDGGVADRHGDYRKVGFDCSGLMIYAFAGADIDLDHYSGYQYQSGRKVPLSSMRRGDMLFWQDSGRTHHVALYLGGGKMVEAPYSGAAVRVSPVRYSGIAPYAVRLL